MTWLAVIADRSSPPWRAMLVGLYRGIATGSRTAFFPACSRLLSRGCAPVYGRANPHKHNCGVRRNRACGARHMAEVERSAANRNGRASDAILHDSLSIYCFHCGYTHGHCNAHSKTRVLRRKRRPLLA